MKAIQRTLLVIIIVGVIVTSATYAVTEYMNKIRNNYEYKLLKITNEAKEFMDNISLALTYLDTARSDFEKALYYLSLANYSIEHSNYSRATQKLRNAAYYFNISHAELQDALSIFYQIEQDTYLISIYVNYTKTALTLTEIGKEMCEQILSGHKNENLTKAFQNQMAALDSKLLQIKNYHGIRR